MTQDMQRLAEMAENLVPPGAITTDDAGFSIDVNGTTLEIFSPGEASYAGYCRAAVARFGEAKFPAAFAEEALKGNFFWRGTGGAVLSMNEEENAVFLTDRFDEGAFEDASALREYLEGFLATIDDWRARLSLYMPVIGKADEGKEAL